MVTSKKSEVVKAVVPQVAPETKDDINIGVRDESIDIPVVKLAEEAPYMAPESVVENTPTRPVAQFKYADSPFPETCTWLDAHGLDPENVGVGGISKGGYRNLMDEDRNWPFTAREVDELWAIYEAELNAADEEEGTVGE